MKAADLQVFPVGEPYGLRDGELIRGIRSPSVYAIEHGKRRAIASEELFLRLGYTWNNVLVLPDALVNAHPLGEPLETPWTPPEDPDPLDTAPSDFLSSSCSSPLI